MRHRPLRLGRILGLAIVIVVALASSSIADHIEVEVDLDSVEVANDAVQMQVIVRTASGQRLPDATVIATRPASIVGVRGEVELARDVSDDLGIARLRWLERRAEPGPITLAYVAPGQTEFETTDLPLLDIVQTAQIERSTAGVAIPILGVWVLIALLVLVWGLVEYALLGTVRVAADGRSEAEFESGASKHGDQEVQT